MAKLKHFDLKSQRYNVKNKMYEYREKLQNIGDKLSHKPDMNIVEQASKFKHDFKAHIFDLEEQVYDHVSEIVDKFDYKEKTGIFSELANAFKSSNIISGISDLLSGFDPSQVTGLMSGAISAAPELMNTAMQAAQSMSDMLSNVGASGQSGTETQGTTDGTQSQNSGESIPQQQTPSNLSTPQSTDGMYLEGKTTADGYGPAYLDKVKQIASKYGLDYKELLAIFASESGVNAHAYDGTYAGVMQMNADACKMVGTTPYQLSRMTPMEQLDYVDKYIGEKKKWPGFNNADDLYAANFLPGRVNNAYLTKKGDHDYIDQNGNWRSYYDDNSALDYNRDGMITKAELASRLDNKRVDESSFKA